jgi:diguanylate cyclase (GGDEF)-like protein/PAS domain S-box-containing protein
MANDEGTRIAGSGADIAAPDDVEALARENRFLRDRIDALMNVTHAAILVIDPESGRIIDANDAAVRRYAGSRDELLSMTIHAINPRPPTEIARRLHQAASNGRNHFEFVHRLADGRSQEVDVYSGPIRYNGRRALISFIHDATRRKTIETKLRDMATYDALTGCLNRRLFMTTVRRAVRGARREASPLAFAMIDLDHFKRINDSHGHLAGDGLLRAVAAAGRGALEAGDALGRLGGEEFGVLMPRTDLETARERMERLRRAVAAARHDASTAVVAVTASVGLARLTPSDAGDETLISRADAALYLAKAAGRDRLEVDPA